MRALTDQQRLFAAKYVELECSTRKAGEALGMTIDQAEKCREGIAVSAEIDRLIALASKDAVVSRSFVRNRLLTIIDRCMEGEPVLYMGEVVKDVVRFRPQAALAAIKQLHEQGYVQEVDPALDDLEEQLTDEERAARVIELFNPRATGGTRPAAPAKKKAR